MTRRHATLPDYFHFDPLFRLLGIFGSLGASGDHHQGHAGQLRQRLQEVLRRLWTANLGAQSVHEECGPEPSPACVQALVQAGKVSQAEVDRIKAQMKGGR